MGISIIVSALVLAGILYGSLLAVSKVIQKKSSTSGSGPELKATCLEIEALDKSLEEAFAYSSQLSPLSMYTELVQRKEAFEENLQNEKNKIEVLENKLKEIQAKVTKEETSHSNLKKGREEAIDLANDIKERKAQLEADQKRLNDELLNSMNQLNVLSGELNLTPEQEVGFNKIKNALKNSQDQLVSLSQTYKQASGRFSTLHGQYSDLEKEFTKLLEKDLAGDDSEDD